MIYLSSIETYNDFIAKKIAILKNNIYKYLRNRPNDLTDEVYYYLRSKNYILNYYEKMYKFKIDDLTYESIDLDKLTFLDPYEEINPTIDDLIYIKLCIENKYYKKHLEYLESLKPKKQNEYIVSNYTPVLRLLCPDMMGLSYSM